MIGRLAALDLTLFELVNGRLTHPALDAVMTAVTTQENWYPILLGLWLALVIWGGRRGRLAAAMLVLAVALSDQVTSSVLKPLVGRARPCNALPPDVVRLLIGGTGAPSFPSAHAANSFAMATIVTWRLRRAAFPAFAIATLVAYSRVYVGVHYPSDAAAGAVLGIVLGRLAIWVVTALWDRWETSSWRRPAGARPRGRATL